MKFNIYCYIFLAAVVIESSCNADPSFNERTRRSLERLEAWNSKRIKRAQLFGINFGVGISSGKKPTTVANQSQIHTDGNSPPKQNSAGDWVNNFVFGPKTRVTSTVPTTSKPEQISTAQTIPAVVPPIETKMDQKLSTDYTENPVSGCVLPEQPIGGDYVVADCAGSCNSVPGTKVPVGSILNYSCGKGYVMKGQNSALCSIQHTWHIPPTCVKTCDPLQSDSVDIVCTYQGEIVSCDSEMMPGTRATLDCKYSYRNPTTGSPPYRKILCQENGSWNPDLFNCTLECGRGLSQGGTLIVNGFTARYGIFPWHVAIYENDNIESQQQICAGTLISSNLVISAAHCFYDDTTKKTKPASLYTVAAGKYYRSYSRQEDNVQKSAVKSIQISEKYYGYTRQHAEDIALLTMETPFKLNSLVRPICVDWENSYEDQHLLTGRVGKAVGWGRTAEGIPSEELQEINLPYVTFNQCISAVPEEFKGFLTSDKFCAGYLNGSSLCNGDSGGGLNFQIGSQWYLRGIVSVSPSSKSTPDMCDNHYYTALTNVGFFMKWIRDIFVP